MAEDAYQGDAQFTVSVDGKQIGGTQTTTALVDQGQQQEFDVHGDFGGGNHTVSVNFLNDQIGAFYPAGTPGLPPGQWADDTTDRNLYVMGMSLNGGAPASGTPWELSSSGSFSWDVGAGSNPSASGTAASSGTSDTAAITSGSLNSDSTGSTTGMNFVASSDTSAAPATSAATDSSGSASSDATGSGSTTSTDTTPSIAAVDTGATPTAQDFSIPSTTNSSDSNTAGGSTGNWWTSPDGGNMASAYFQQNG
jgi:hypothetical protein